MKRGGLEWVCTSTHCVHAAPLTPLSRLFRLPWPRLQRDTWLRYRLSLADSMPGATDAMLTPIDAHWMERLQTHPEREQPQVRSAFRFWQARFGEGYLWLEEGEPLCMIWLLLPQHASARAALGPWAGIYPPLPAGLGVAEGIYAFRRGLRRPGGVATATAFALINRARELGLRELRTHIHEANINAQRWAARVGWQPFGRIQRYCLDLPRLREHPLYLHELADFPSRAETSPTTPVYNGSISAKRPEVRRRTHGESPR